jgi:hypothetical protein
VFWLAFCEETSRSSYFQSFVYLTVKETLSQDVQNLFQFLPPSHNNQNFDRCRQLCRQWRHCVQNHNQIFTILVAEVELKRAVDQNFEYIEQDERKLKVCDEFASWPETKNLPSKFLDWEKEFL